jgi:hypothetical protein
VNDLGTVIALGLIFSPFTIKTLIFAGVSVVVFIILPFLTPRFFKRYGGRVSELEAKYLVFLLFGMGGSAVWSGSEAVLPAYIICMVSAGTVGHRQPTLVMSSWKKCWMMPVNTMKKLPALACSDPNQESRTHLESDRQVASEGIVYILRWNSGNQI